MTRPPADGRWHNPKNAEQWARSFDYARALLNLPPLEVRPDGDAWIIADPSKEES